MYTPNQSQDSETIGWLTNSLTGKQVEVTMRQFRTDDGSIRTIVAFPVEQFLRWKIALLARDLGRVGVELEDSESGLPVS